MKVLSDNKEAFTGLALQWLWLLISLFILVLNGCKAPTAAECAQLYPCRDSLVVNERVEWDTIDYMGTYVQYIDTTICPPASQPSTIIDTLRVPVPGKRIPIERLVKDSTWYRRDSAQIISMMAALDNEIKARQQAETELLACQAGGGGKTPWWVALLAAVLGFFINKYLPKK